MADNLAVIITELTFAEALVDGLDDTPLGQLSKALDKISERVLRAKRIAEGLQK